MNEATATKQPGAANMILFLLLFLIPASFTYLSGMFLGVRLVDEEITANEAFGARMLYLGVCYAIMTLACFLRGRTNSSTWLIAFPIVGGVFDIFLVFIPFVPSVMNIAVLVTGIPIRK